ncbi:hypothetical protein CN172_26505 [Sinorhizobium meliloti]|nr:hypothetical protein CN232_22685 [Sinorhizobium meliloti]RVH40262.1 hypothetical protein CN208_25185 [Sinorhizobium meliloti]RVK07578.1 hypothetical protein CN172_26505 [Sinorhizobium meliloti]
MTNSPDTPATVAAAQWLADQKEPPERAVPTLKQKFGLSALEACRACRLAQEFRSERRDC